MLASLNHANVAQIFGFESSSGRAVLVMEFIDGLTLAERIGQGRFLMVQREDAPQTSYEPASIVVVQNWLEELKQRVPKE